MALPGEGLCANSKAAAEQQLPPAPGWLAAACLLLALALFGFGLCRLWPLTIDDAFISARYARNLAHGLGLVYNPGDHPTEGFSNLTLVLLTAACVRAGLEAITAAKVIAALSGFLCLLFAALSGRLLLPRHYPYAVLLCATSFPLLVWSVAGLETSLMAMLAALWLYLGLRLVRLENARPQWGLGAVTVLAALTRPEGLLFVPALALVLWSQRSKSKMAWGPLVAALAALAVHEAWRVSYFGQWLPLPFYAKVEVGSALDKLSGLYYAHAFLWACGGGALAYLALLYGWLRRRGQDTVQGEYVALLALAPFLLFVCAVGSDWMPQYRFLVPVIVPLSLLTVGLLVAISEALGQARPRVAALVFAGGMLALLAGNVAGGWRALRHEEWHSTRMERLDLHWKASEALRQQGQWLRDHGGSRLTVAALDIGAPGYYSDAHIIDMHGLTDRALAGESPAAIADYVLLRRPDFIQVYGHPLLDRPEFRRNYEQTDLPWSLWTRRGAPR